jgi:hypothetical protein
MVALGFFAGLSLGLMVAIGIMVWLFRLMQSNVIQETIAELMEEGGGEEGGDEDCPSGFRDDTETQEEWWKRDS